MTRVANRTPAPPPPPSRSGSRLALGVAAGVFALALVGVGVYSLTGGSERTVGVPAEQRTLQQTPSVPTTEPTAAESRQAEVPTPEPVAGPEAPRRVTPSATTTAKGPKPRAGDARPDAPSHAGAPEAPLPEPEAAAEPATPRHPLRPGREGVNRPMTKEEIRELIRQGEEQRRRARLMRQRILRDQRRRQGSETPPAPPTRPRQP